MERSAGILLHLTSLPSPHGIGDLGPEALAFADWLRDAGMSWWQILPLAPTAPGLGNSPYSGYSAFAGNIDFISPDLLVRDGFLSRAEAGEKQPKHSERVDFDAVRTHKLHILKTAFAHARPFLDRDEEFTRFLADNAMWLNDFTMFMALKEYFKGRAWTGWPAPLRDRHNEALRDLGTILADEVLLLKFGQYLFFRQWGEFKAGLRERSIGIIGDAPIYVTHDSSDVWANRDLFKLDPEGNPLVVAGVPPDYFSKTGQRWGNPVFDWDANRERDFGWWLSRIRHTLGLVDMVRLDHFRGFAAYWEIDAEEKTAVKGRWVRAEGKELFRRLTATGPANIIAEDLGVITGDVIDLRREFGFPGMHILQFAFMDGAGADSRDLPYNHEHNAVVYTGTHDNNTTLGWFQDDITKKARARLGLYAGGTVSGTVSGTVTRADVCREMIRLALGSCARLAVIPVQDVLELDQRARMNTPSVAKGNWGWRLDRIPDAARAERLKDMADIYGRTGDSEPQFDSYARNPG